MENFNVIFLTVTIISATGLIYIIYSRSIEGISRKLYILTLLLVIGYLISHAVHFVIMHTDDVTILDQSCHSFLLLIILALTFFSYYFPAEKNMAIPLKIFLILPTVTLLAALWSGYLVEESHAHARLNRFEAHYGEYYWVYLIWYVTLLFLSIYFLVNKFFTIGNKEYKTQILTILIGLIITNLTAFLFGLYLPWILGFYFLIEISPLAFFIGVILTTTIAISKFNMFPAAISKLQTFSLNKKIFFAALIVVPIVILLVQVPLGRIIFNIKTAEEWQTYFLVSLAGGILVSTAMAFIISRIIANPINKLTEKAGEIQHGNYGIKVDYFSSDEIGKLAVTFNNMSETLKKDSLELDQRQKKIQMLLNAFEKSNAAICVCNFSGEILEVNSQFVKLFEEKRENLLNKNLYEITLNSTSLTELTEVLKQFKEKNIVEEEIKIKISSELKYYLISVTPFYFNEIDISGFLLIAVDISKIKHLETQLAKSEKLAALGKMAAVLAHEIKTPLTSIKMNSDMLAESPAMGKDDKQSINIINKEINRLNNLVKEVLQFARQVNLNKHWIDLKELVDEIIFQNKKRFAEKKFCVINNCKNTNIYGDKEKLLRVFLNIIENSFEAVNNEGMLEISSQVNGNKICINFIDNGNGIPAEIIDKIFDPFYTTKSSGTGLGLAIAQKIIEQHSGEIKLISSEPGKTIFEISFII